MKLLVNASIFSVVFAGFVASAVTIKPTRITLPITVWSSLMPCPFPAATPVLVAWFRTPCPFPAAIPALDVPTKGRFRVLTQIPLVPKRSPDSTKVPVLKAFFG